MVKINGNEENVAGQSLKTYLLNNEYVLERIAVERNEEIVLKSDYDAILIEDGDVIEVVNFVAGG